MKKLLIILLFISCTESDPIDLTVKEKILSISSVWQMVETTPHSDTYLSFENDGFNLIINNVNLGCYFEIVYSTLENNTIILTDTDTMLEIEVNKTEIWTFSVQNDVVTWNIESSGNSRIETFNPSTFNKQNETNCN